jgi:hypothetical protein
VDVDPIASMRIWAVDVQVGGHTFEVPPLPAADWMPTLIDGDLSQILDLLRSTTIDVDELILTGSVSGEDLSEALLDAVEAAAGRPFQAAYVLAQVAAAHWGRIGGRLAQRGFRWDLMPLGAALDAIYAMVVENMKDADLAKFEALLNKPPKLAGGKRRAVDLEKAMDEFESIAGPRPTAGVKSTGAPSDNARPKTQQRRRPPRQDDP